MNRYVYYLGFLFLGLLVFSGFLQSIIYIAFGTRTYFQPSFFSWFVLVRIIYLAGALILLKYYHSRKYWFTFSAGIAAIIASICQFFILYRMLLLKENSDHFDTAYLASLGTGIVYTISLIFSSAGKRYWLKTAGILGTILGVILMSTFIWYLNSGDAAKEPSEIIFKWAQLPGSLVPVLFIMNFLSELKALKAENIKTPVPEWVKGCIVSVAIFTLFPLLFLALNLASETLAAFGIRALSPRAKVLAQQFEARTYVNSNGDSLLYRILIPLDYDSAKKYPLVVCLHHGGAHGSDNIRQIEGSEPAQLLYANRKKYPAFLFVPQCPVNTGWGGIPTLPSIDSLVFETISVLEKEYSIDEKRRYVTGISGGGYGSWYFISTRPKMFAAAIPICGAGDPKYAQDLITVPVWAFHGEKDRAVPVRFTRDMIESIKKAGGNPHYTEIPGAGHNIWNEVRAAPGLLDWLFAQKQD